jgi:hypothetical protein
MQGQFDGVGTFSFGKSGRGTEDQSRDGQRETRSHVSTSSRVGVSGACRFSAVQLCQGCAGIPQPVKRFVEQAFFLAAMAGFESVTAKNRGWIGPETAQAPKGAAKPGLAAAHRFCGQS